MLREPSYVKSAKKLSAPIIKTNFRADLFRVLFLSSDEIDPYFIDISV
jgi:hypothetical protein